MRPDDRERDVARDVREGERRDELADLVRDEEVPPGPVPRSATHRPPHGGRPRPTSGLDGGHDAR